VNESIQLRFDYESLETETRRFVLERAERIHNLARVTATGIVQIGRHLTEVKEHMEHGQFLTWIEREFGWSRTTAWRFMEVHEKIKCSNLEHLQIDVSALYLIASPSFPEPVRQQIITRAENGESVTYSGTRALVKHFTNTGEMPDIETDLYKMIAEERRLRKPTPPPGSAEERARYQQFREKVAANTAHNNAVFQVVEGIEHIAKSSLSMTEIAREIDQLDTPDKDWHGQAREAQMRLRLLCKELKK